MRSFKFYLKFLFYFIFVFVGSLNLNAEGGHGIISNEPRDDGIGSNNIPSKYHVDFTPKKADNKTYDMKLKWGGAGHYVHGDFAMTGKSVVKDKRGKEYNGYMYNGNTVYLKENFQGFVKNSSEQDIWLPKDVTTDDIVYAGLYWQGYVFKKGQLTEKQANGLIQNYKTVKLKVGANPKIHTIKRQYCGGDLSYNGSGNGSMFRMFYGCGADITNIVKEAAKNSYDFKNINQRKFTVGDIITTDGADSHGTSFYNDWTSFRMGSYGGWSVIVVYSKDKEARERLSKDVVKAYYKPKSISIYEGYAMLKPWNNRPVDEVKLNFSGFFTPKSGKVSSKMGFVGFAGEKQINRGEYLKILNQKYGKWVNLNNGSKVGGDGSVNIYDGSERYLETQNDGSYRLKDIQTGFSYYNIGIDVDQFDISDYVANSQSSLSMELGAKFGSNNADQNFVSMVTFSTDIYVPQLCYQEDIYNTEGWLKFFDKSTGNRIKPAPKPKTIEDGSTVVAGEQLFYRVKFENKDVQENDDALGTYVKVDFQGYNTYVANSSHIDNTLKHDYIGKADFKYIKDNEKGAWDDQGFKNQATSSVYSGKQLNSLINGNELKYYIGESAGRIGSSGPLGGTMGIGKRAFVEYNATVGREDYKFHYPTYFVGYKIKPANGQEVSFEGIEMEKCEDRKANVFVTLLNGLKIVNQNYTNESKEQDDRLYTQISDKGFKANFVYEPDITPLFKDPSLCLKKDSEGRCIEYDLEKLKELKHLFDEKGNFKKLQKFNLGGNLYLSLIRAKDIGSCFYLGNSDKLPFKIGDKRYRKDFELNFRNDPKYKSDSILPLNDLTVEDAFKGVSFMISYYPGGLSSEESNPEDSNNLNSNYGSSGSYKDKLDQMKPEDKKKYEADVEKAEKMFGIKQSEDGSFHICSSDIFSVRPAYFSVETGSLNRYGALVNTNANGDATQAQTNAQVQNSNTLRIAGDYTENTDVATRTFYALSNTNHAVPNYNPILGENLSQSLFKLKSAYFPGNSSDNVKHDIEDIYKVSFNKTFLEPFISTACAGSINTQSFYIPNNTNNTLQVGTKGDCNGGLLPQYHGYNTVDKTLNLSKYLENSEKAKQIGKIAQSPNCTGAIFDERNRRVWDLNAISLIADFGVKTIKSANSQTFDIGERWSEKDLRKEALKRPSEKAKRPAMLYTANLLNGGTNIGKIFNYYNVGDVKVNVYDNTWTEAYGDQIWSKKWNSPSCILNSSTNIPDKDGKIGCDVGMQNDRTLILRYQPHRIAVTMTGIGNSNLNPVSNTSFTYYNSPELDGRNLALSGFSQNLLRNAANEQVNPVYNQALVNNLNNLASLQFKATAFISDRVYPNTVATLFDGRVVEGNADGTPYEMPRCGFSTDVNLDLRFNFDCASAASAGDPRCIRNVNPSTTVQNVVFRPFVNLNGVFYNIPNGTQFFSDAQCSVRQAAFDSRCFKFDTRTLQGANLHQATGSAGNAQIPIPLLQAINFYSDSTRNSNVINRVQDANPTGNNQIMYNPKRPLYTILKRGFNQGNSDSVAYFNFERSQKNPNRPLIIIGDDFNIINTNVIRNLQTPSFDRNGNLLNANNSLLIRNNVFTGRPKINSSDFTAPNIQTVNTDFVNYVNSQAAAEGINANQFRLNNRLYAYFVYGNINYHGPNNIAMGGLAGGAGGIFVNNRVYCGMNDNCANLPNNFADFIPNTLFSDLIANRAKFENGWGDNIFDIYNAANIQTGFVNRYASDDAVSIRRSNSTDAKGERLTITSTAPGTTSQINVFTNQWSIYTPNITEMLTDITGDFYNFFFVTFPTQGNWGGEGSVKNSQEDGDVGNFVGGKKFDSTSKDMSFNKDELRQNRRIEW